MRAEIVSIGEELLLGEIVDTNAAHIARALVETGIVVRHKHTVGDEVDAASAILRTALGRTNVIVITGGIGPTKDDITREAIAAAAGRELLYDETLMAPIAERLGRPVDALSENQKRQAMVVAGSRPITNPRGTAPGIFLDHGGVLLFAMPGVPHEMRGMFQDDVLPVLRQRVVAEGTVVRVRRLHVLGLGESVIDERLGDLMVRGNNPEVGTRVTGGSCTVRILARARSEAEADEMIGRVEARCRKALASHLYGVDEDSLQSTVIGLFSERGLTLALAESCTGGRVASMLTDVPGSSRVLREGIVAYSNEAKRRYLGVDDSMLSRYGAVSAEVAEQMARGIRHASGADVALSVTGIAGPDGGSTSKPVGLVHLAVCSARGSRGETRNFRGERELIRDRATKVALGLLREEALALGRSAESEVQRPEPEEKT